MLRNLILDRTKSLAARELQAQERFPTYKAIEVPPDIDGLPDADLFALFEKLFERRIFIDSPPQC